MSSGRVVLTSKEAIQCEKAKRLIDAEWECEVIGNYTIKEGADVITWKFNTEDEAIRHARIFMNIGFHFVQRII